MDKIYLEYKEELWFKYLYNTSEINYNYNHISSLKSLNNKIVYNYVKRCFDVLNSLSISEEAYYYVSSVLKWMDVSKCGSKSDRKRWTKLGYNLSVHNLGSASIYLESNNDLIVYELIKSHGLLGQYIQGENNLSLNSNLVGLLPSLLLKEVLIGLNRCILDGVYVGLYSSVQIELESLIKMIVSDNIESVDYSDSLYIKNRIKRLRKNNYNDDYSILDNILNNKVKTKLGLIFKHLELWYFEISLRDFSLEEVIKLLLLINVDISNYKHLTFESVMKMIYFDHNGHKVINVYKKRIIEHFLKSITIEEIINNNISYSKHININTKIDNETLIYNFEFSESSIKLIEFCEVSYGSDEIYNKAIILLYDLFGFRRDVYDRFYNEDNYLEIMNKSLSHKAKILEYIVGTKVLDVGPGGGALMDLMESVFKDKKIYGMDISENVIRELNRKKSIENHKWNVIKGDALELNKYIEGVDTVIYSSIIHELYSYIETEGLKFNYKTILNALTSAYDILNVGGRIIIRDGIMTENKGDKRIIEFKNIEDLNILNNYCNDFKGRTISYQKISDNKVIMLVNDAMEFLYTYTWGEDSYAHEVNEQFGYFTPNEYIEFFNNNFKDKFKLIECKHFLQDGYEEHLLKKISLYDLNGNVVSLPDSTCIIVVEKIK
jgi:cyclopropane fatty-acyl-phospholipid synthase-like methyltransferase